MLDILLSKYKNEKLNQKNQFVAAQSSESDDPDFSTKVGLEQISKNLVKLADMNLPELENIRAPQKKLFVMILGNHSSGKSSFINWYIRDNIQKTAVSIETVDINLIMHGNKRRVLNGYNLIKEFPFIEDLFDKKTKNELFEGLLPNMSAKTSPSKVNSFENIVFIDTPGLVDGNLAYKFDVDQAYSWLAKHCDLVFAFFDPQGQALCDKTNSIVKKMIDDKVDVRFFLTKGDVFETPADAIKTACQITQELTKTIEPAHGFEMPIIYLPTKARSTERLLPNQIFQIDELIQKKLAQKVQNSLATYKNHITLLQQTVTSLKNTQDQLSGKPIQQVMNLSKQAVMFLGVILAHTICNLVFTDSIQHAKLGVQRDQNPLNIVVSLFIQIFSAANFVYSQFFSSQQTNKVFIFCVLSITAFLIIIDQIPKKFKVFSPETIERLDSYKNILQDRKKEQSQLAFEVNNQAFEDHPSCHDQSQKEESPLTPANIFDPKKISKRKQIYELASEEYA